MIDSASTVVCYSIYSSPIGELMLTSDGEALTGLHDVPAQREARPGPGPGWRRDDSAFRAVREQLEAYFRASSTISTLPMRMAGTPFQQQVWAGLRAIPYGETISYAELAGRIGRPGASRAVGSANGRNPIAIVVPCHRVIAADGTLGGYGGGARPQGMAAPARNSRRSNARGCDAVATPALRRARRSLSGQSPLRPAHAPECLSSIHFDRELAALQVDLAPARVAAHGVGPGHLAARELHGVVGKPSIGLAIVGADKLGSAGQSLVALGDVAGAGLARVGIGPRANQEAVLDQTLDLVEILDRVVDLEPGGRRDVRARRSRT